LDQFERKSIPNRGYAVASAEVNGAGTHAADLSKVNARQRWRGRRVGLLGGSFNPAHEGHRQISRLALAQLQLDAVWWLVSPQNPLKSRDDMAAQPARLASARLAAGDARILATDIESRIGTRYTVDTIAQLLRHYPKTRFFWLMGADNLLQFHRWRNWRRIAGLVAIAVAPRPGYAHARWSAQALVRLWSRRRRIGVALCGRNIDLPAILMLSGPMSALSATQERRARPGWSALLSGVDRST
jgi:nicotinate-nucleotide adenylyltransferase